MKNHRTLGICAGLALAAAVAAFAPTAVRAGDGAGAGGTGDVPKGKDGAPYVVGKEVGKDVPDINLNWCLNDEGRNTVAEHRGEVVLVDLWSTTCGPCRGLIPSFTKEQAELGKKGLHIFGITGETKDVLAKFLATGNTSEIGYNMASGSSGGLLSPGTVPYCFVVGADGKVVWQGHGHPPAKLIDAELKKVVPPTAEQLQARAQKSLERAEKLMSDKRLLQATELLARIAAKYPGTDAATKAAERTASITQDAALAADLAAQKDLAKILGGTEFPKEKLSKKECVAKLKQIEALVKGTAASCEGAKAIAAEWTPMLQVAD